MPFTLTLLGTDTKFENAITNTIDYPACETLSLATLLIKKEEATHSESAVEHICQKTHTIIDGPKTIGSEVYDRINLALFRLLNGVANGEDTLQIIAHSRGSCEAILVSHEFDRIKKLLERCTEEEIDSNFAAIVSQFQSSMVKNLNIEAVEDGFFQPNHLKAIKRHITSSKLALFLIDPVPGGSFLGLDKISRAANYVASSVVRSDQDVVKSLKWDDPLFYQLPESVDHLELFVMENEHTRCFKPIVPVKREGMSFYQVQTLPGHHGTASGNPYDQQKTFRLKEYEIEHTLGVQKIVFSKLIKFLQNQGHQFQLEEYPKHSIELIDIAETVISSDSTSYRTHLIKQKEHIHINIKAYERFNQTAYAYLGQEYGLSSLSENTRRIIHHGSEKDSFLFDMIPSGRTKGFLDWEHIDLVMQSCLEGPFNHLDPIRCIQSLRNEIEHPSDKFDDLKKELLPYVVNNFSHNFINDNLHLSDEQISLFLNEVEQLLIVLKSKEDSKYFNFVLITLKDNLDKKIKRLVSNSKQMLKPIKFDVDELNQLFLSPELDLEQKSYITTQLELLASGCALVAPESDEFAMAFETLQKWTQEKIVHHQQESLHQLCQNFQKLFRLKNIITQLCEKEIYFESTIREVPIDIAIATIRDDLITKMTEAQVAPHDLHSIVDNPIAYSYLTACYIEKYPEYLINQIKKPLQTFSNKLQLLNLRINAPIPFLDTSGLFLDTKPLKTSVADYNESIEKVNKDRSFLTAQLAELAMVSHGQSEFVHKYLRLKTQIEEMNQNIQTFFYFIPELESTILTEQLQLDKINQLLTERDGIIKTEMTKIQSLILQGEQSLSMLTEEKNRYQREVTEKITREHHQLSRDIEQLNLQLIPTHLENNEHWYASEIERITQVIQQYTAYQASLLSQIEQIVELDTSDTTLLQEEISLKQGQLTQKIDELNIYKDRLNSLKTIYSESSFLDEEENGLPDLPSLPESANLESLYQFHELRTNFIQQEGPYFKKLEEKISQYKILIDKLSKIEEFDLLREKISEHQQSLTEYELSKRRLNDQLEILIGCDQHLVNSYQVGLKQLISYTKKYQTHLNGQSASQETILLNRKKEIVAELLEDLNKKAQPSYVNMYQFHQRLEQVKHELAEHRDPAWQRYLALTIKCTLVCTLLAGCILLGLSHGIGLGVAALCAVSLALVGHRHTQSYEHFSFFRSKGEMFVESASKVPHYA